MIVRIGDRSPQTQATGVWIAPNATVVGQTVLAEDVSIWFGAVLRADNEPISIGQRTNIQDLCVLHTDPGFPLTIGMDCTIGHKAVLHGCTIDDGSMVGIGAIVLNGAKVGKRCVIGAGAFVPEGMEIPDRSLVIGLPGKVKREISDTEVQRLLKNAAHYVDRARQYESTAVIVT